MFSRVWVLLVLLLPCAATWAQETSMVPVIVDGQTVRLELRIYKPARTGPLPTLVFNHGSTGRGRDSRLFKQPIDFPALAQFFVQRGWAVLMPARQGRAGSAGLYTKGSQWTVRSATPATQRSRFPGRTVPCATLRLQWTRSSQCRSSTATASLSVGNPAEVF